ncbi:MAG: dTDP-4-dehydrorhamnose 3,5-epimerase [Rhizobiales bacterium]|nr:dTDP-4-dehydrorhamnose 3,5-epimerase [Hyphomicrobiales bacterium]
MIISATKIDGVFHLEVEPAADERGQFARTFCVDELSDAGIDFNILQTNISTNTIAGTLRGMHYQRDPHGEQKIVRCSRGSIFDVAVDVRPGSDTYLQWASEILSSERMNALYIPTGFAHGFITLTDDCEITYLMARPYVADAGAGFRWDDPAFAIKWPRVPAIMSERDANWPEIKP